MLGSTLRVRLTVTAGPAGRWRLQRGAPELDPSPLLPRGAPAQPSLRRWARTQRGFTPRRRRLRRRRPTSRRPGWRRARPTGARSCWTRRCATGCSRASSKRGRRTPPTYQRCAVAAGRPVGCCWVVLPAWLRAAGDFVNMLNGFPPNPPNNLDARAPGGAAREVHRAHAGAVPRRARRPARRAQGRHAAGPRQHREAAGEQARHQGARATPRRPSPSTQLSAVPFPFVRAPLFVRGTCQPSLALRTIVCAVPARALQVTGLESYLVDVDACAAELRSKLACSTT